MMISFALILTAACGFVASQDDLDIKVTHPVQCDRKSKNGDLISVNYNGTFTNGTAFDSSYEADGRSTPFEFKLGAGRVIKGWDLGLRDMCIQERRTLTVPPRLGYGDKPYYDIPANSVLVFETELVGIKDAS